MQISNLDLNLIRKLVIEARRYDVCSKLIQNQGVQCILLLSSIHLIFCQICVDCIGVALRHDLEIVHRLHVFICLQLLKIVFRIWMMHGILKITEYCNLKFCEHLSYFRQAFQKMWTLNKGIIRSSHYELGY